MREREADRAASEQHIQQNTHTKWTNHLRALQGLRQAMLAARGRARKSHSPGPLRLKKNLFIDNVRELA
jgi:hypothetical protein